MEPAGKTKDALQPKNTASLNGKADWDGSMAAPTIGHPSKRDRQTLPSTNSPSKRTKLSGFFGHYSTLPNGRMKHKLGTARGFKPEESGVHNDAPQPRKNYLGNSGKRNALGDLPGAVQPASGLDAVTEATAEKLSISDRREGLGIFDNGTRLSTTPPPFSVECEDLTESPLPPIIGRQHTSPGTVKRGLEEIYSSGNRKPRYESFEHRSTPDWSPTRKSRPNAPKETTDHYYPALSSGIKDKAYRTFLGHRDALRQEVRLLEDELVVARRKALIEDGPKAITLTSNEVSDFITQCLDSNDEEIIRNVAPVQDGEEVKTDPYYIIPCGKISSQHGMKDLCLLTFTDYNPRALVPDSSSSHHRIIQGYSHENLLHFKASMEVLSVTDPAVYGLKVECSDWARTELGQHLSKLSKERNISIALYSISSYAALARKRAETWVTLQSRFSKFIPVAIQSEPTLKFQVPKMLEAGVNFGRRFLVANLPRRKITFRGRNALSNTRTSTEAEICFSWHIEIKATGESCSDISANIKLLPGGVDEMQVTQQMSNLFNALVGEYGFVEGAARLLETLFGGS